VAVAAILATEMKSLLLGEAPAPEHLRAIGDALAQDGIASLIHLRIMHLGPEELLVAAKFEPAPGLDVAGVAKAIDLAEERSRAAVALRQTIYLEPDLRRVIDGEED
jgi:divalent metal cation (Fe/Co/Zn/Cd) transporter